MTTQTAFQPLTKDDVATALRISTRCVENWVNDGTLIPPAKLGNRVYWHPEAFYKWLGDQLTKQHATVTHAAVGPALVNEMVKHSPKPQPKIDERKRDLIRLRGKNEALLAKLVAS